MVSVDWYSRITSASFVSPSVHPSVYLSICLSHLYCVDLRGTLASLESSLTEEDTNVSCKCNFRKYIFIVTNSFGILGKKERKRISFCMFWCTWLPAVSSNQGRSLDYISILNKIKKACLVTVINSKTLCLMKLKFFAIGCLYGIQLADTCTSIDRQVF